MLWPVAVLLFTYKTRGDQFGEATIWPVREHSVYELNAAVISLENIRVAAKLVCGGGLYGWPPPSTR